MIAGVVAGVRFGCSSCPARVAVRDNSYQINFSKCLDATAKMLNHDGVPKGRIGSLLRSSSCHRFPSQFVKQLICYEPDLCNLGHRFFRSTTRRCGPQIYALSLSVRRVSFLRFVVLLSAILPSPCSRHRFMSSTGPARDSNSPPVPIPSNTSSSLPYSSRPERTPNSRGTSSVDPSSATPPIPLPTSPSLASSTTRQPPQQQPEPGTSHIPSSPSIPASPKRFLSESNQDRRMHSPSSSSQGDTADTEMESGPSSSHPAGQHKPQDSPQKKKRTRTLTTPHQSAVLHALLAQVSPLSVTPSIPINTLF